MLYYNYETEPYFGSLDDALVDACDFDDGEAHPIYALIEGYDWVVATFVVADNDGPTCNGDYHHVSIPRNLLVECTDSLDADTGECIHWCVWCRYEANTANGEYPFEALLLALGAKPLDK